MVDFSLEHNHFKSSHTTNIFFESKIYFYCYYYKFKIHYYYCYYAIIMYITLHFMILLIISFPTDWHFSRWSDPKCVNRSEFRANWQVSCSKAYRGIVWTRIGSPSLGVGAAVARHWLQAQKMSCFICVYFIRSHSLFLVPPHLFVLLFSSFCENPDDPDSPGRSGGLSPPAPRTHHILYMCMCVCTYVALYSTSGTSIPIVRTYIRTYVCIWTDCL